MTGILQFFIDVKDSVSGVNQVLILVSTLGAAILFLLRKTIAGYRNRRFLVKRLMPFYDEQIVERATGIYVPTRCQNVDPAQEDEPRSVHAFVAKNRLIPLLAKLLQSGQAAKYYIVLADTGMGKTTFMINFFLRYARKWRPRYKVRLFPLGDPRTDAAIEGVEDKEDTVLLLDAFDEDGLAIIDYVERLDQLIEKTRDFRCVVMSSRTQFFPSHVEEPAKTGVLKHGGEKGEHEFKKLYLSPFDDWDIRLFVRKKYAWYQPRKRRRARRIVATCPHLVVRPMLLSYIEDLMVEGVEYEYSHQIYEAMVQRWIHRERVENKEDLRRFSEAIALHMYRHQKERKGLFVEPGELVEFAERHNIRLEEFELKSRSLLNRDAEGRLKFAHKSILEYLLALELLRNPEVRQEFEIHRMEFAGMILESLREAYLRHVVGQCRHEFSLEADSGETASFGLEAIYTPLLTLPEARGGRGSVRGGLSALEQLDGHPRLLLLGELGSGKSTFANFVALCLAGEALGLAYANLDKLTHLPFKGGVAAGRRQSWKHGPLLPVCVSLPDFARELPPDGGSAEDLWRFVTAELDAVQIGGIVPELRRELGEQGGLLILDALDQVPEQKGKVLQNVLESFCRDYPQCRVLMTSQAEAADEESSWATFDRATLAPFNDGQIRWFVSRWFDQLTPRRSLEGARVELLRAFDKYPVLCEIAGNPRMLLLLARNGIAHERLARSLTHLMQDPAIASKRRLEAGLVAADVGALPSDLDTWVEISPDALEYPFKIGKYPVTNGQYQCFVEAGGYGRENGWFSDEAQREILAWEERFGGGGWPTGPRYGKRSHLNCPTLPVTCVTWYEAAAYAAWLTEDLRAAGAIGSEDTLRLVTVAEWQRAAGGTEGRKYSWEGEFDRGRANTKESELGQPSPVDMYPAGTTPEGVFDLTGNVWEWTADEAGKGIFWLAGGSYLYDRDGVGAAARGRRGRDLRLGHVGFRVVVVPISRADPAS